MMMKLLLCVLLILKSSKDFFKIISCLKTLHKEINSSIKAGIIYYKYNYFVVVEIL